MNAKMLQKMMDVLRRWLGVSPKESQPVTKNGMPHMHEKKPMLQCLEDYLMAHYEFRFNVLTEQTEYRPKEGKGSYRLVDQRVLNTFCIEAKTMGINCWDRDVNRLLCSQKIGEYHPFLDYMESLPEWDGVDRVTELATRISDAPHWVNGFHRWMLGMAAQWMGMPLRCANALAPILISSEQGRCKSTFCSMLLPDELQRFYIDKFDITSESGCEQKLSLFGLVNMDEFDRYSPRAMATLKNLMQLKKLNFRKSHRNYYSQLPRIASFIGTSNQKDLLTDTTGSRRFLCVEVTENIDCTKPDHAQLYAQLKTELQHGERYWLTSEEEREIQHHNRFFYKQSPEQEVFFRCFRLPENEEEGVQLSATEIFCRLQKKYPAAVKGNNASGMGKILVAIGAKRIKTKLCNMYSVVPL